MPDKIIYPRIEAAVKFYSRARGFGFLKRPNKPDVFFSNNDLLKAKINLNHVAENALFEFDHVPVKGKEGGRADNMKLLQRAKNEGRSRHQGSGNDRIRDRSHQAD